MRAELRSTSRARPYKLFGARERSLLTELLEQRLAQWARDWFARVPALRLECFLKELAPQDWLAFGNASDEWWALSADVDALALALCGARAGATRSTLAAEVARRALHELAAALVGSPVTPLERVAPEAGLPGSASLAARARLGDAALVLVSSPQWTLRALKERSPAPAPAAFVGRRAAVASRPVGLRVVAGWAELDLGDLRGLQEGDVITLDARLDRPMNVVLGDRPICGARVGLKDGHRAAALIHGR